MKKNIVSILVFFCLAGIIPLVAASYDNNEFQRKSRSFTELATTSFDEGDYDAALVYAKEAEKYANLSAELIEKAITRAETQDLLYKAHTRLTWAKGLKAEIFFPSAFESASLAIASGDSSFASEDFPSARAFAEKAIESLVSVREITPLPAFYRIDKWASAKDCFWNIASNPAIYGNPFMWDKLYKANKGKLKRPSNPNLLLPGMLIAIPSIQGEYREGTYDPSIKYESLKSQKK